MSQILLSRNSRKNGAYERSCCLFKNKLPFNICKLSALQGSWQEVSHPAGDGWAIAEQRLVQFG